MTRIRPLHAFRNNWRRAEYDTELHNHAASALLLSRCLPRRDFGRLGAETELWQRHGLVDVEETDLDALADGDVVFVFGRGGIVHLHEVGHDAQRYVLVFTRVAPRHFALFV